MSLAVICGTPVSFVSCLYHLWYISSYVIGTKSVSVYIITKGTSSSLLVFSFGMSLTVITYVQGFMQDQN